MSQSQTNAIVPRSCVLLRAHVWEYPCVVHVAGCLHICAETRTQKRHASLLQVPPLWPTCRRGQGRCAWGGHALTSPQAADGTCDAGQSVPLGSWVTEGPEPLPMAMVPWQQMAVVVPTHHLCVLGSLSRLWFQPLHGFAVPSRSAHSVQFHPGERRCGHGAEEAGSSVGRESASAATVMTQPVHAGTCWTLSCVLNDIQGPLFCARPCSR